jgi:hypothetical protein
MPCVVFVALKCRARLDWADVRPTTLAKGRSDDLLYAHLNSGLERSRTLTSEDRLNRLGNYSGRCRRCADDAGRAPFPKLEITAKAIAETGELPASVEGIAIVRDVLS